MDFAAGRFSPGRSHRRGATAALLGVIAAVGVVRATAAEAPDALAEHYRPYMIADIDQALDGAKLLKARVAAADLDGAKKQWIAARVGWERAEVFTNGFVAELDEEIDAWPNAFTGFHAIEAKLFGAGRVDVGDEADRLVYRLTDLDIKIKHMPLNAQGLLNGTARLAYEVGESKADGGESRYSGTSLDDMRNNVDGIRLAYDTIFAPPLEDADPKLAAATKDSIEQLRAVLAVAALKTLDPDSLRARSEEVVVMLQKAAPRIDLHAPTLEELTQ